LIATARLEHFAVVTFAADRGALERLLPDGVEVDLPLVSAVAYRYKHLRVCGVPGVTLTGGQVHFRAYVRVGAHCGVWFLATVQDSRWANLPRWVWGMPWSRGAVDVSAPRDGQVVVSAAGVDMELRQSSPGTSGPPIPTQVSTATAGWYQGRRNLMRFDVSFDELCLVPATATVARVERFEDLGLVSPGQAPDSAFRHGDTEIQIHLPPRPIPAARH